MKTTYMNAKQQVVALTLTVATVLSLAWISPDKHTPQKEKTAPGKKAPGKPAVKLLKRTEVKTITTQTVLPDDTSKKKKKFKIVTVGPDGVQKEYNSVKELPDSLRAEVVSETFLNGGDFRIDFNLDSTIAKQMMFIKSPEFKKQLEDVKIQAGMMARQVQSADFKKIQADAKKMAEEARKMGEDMAKHFKSKEFKKQLEDMKKLHDSPEFKQLKEKFDKDLEQLKKEKGIKSDLKTLNFSPDRLIITDGPETEEVRIFKAD